MAKFSKKSKTELTKTVNRAGGEAFKLSTRLQLVTLLLTSFVKDQFYRKEKQTYTELEALIAGLPDKKFVAKALIYTRNVIGMRSISHAGTAYLLKYTKGETWTKEFVSQMIRIPQDATEIFAFYEQNIGKPFPNALKKGVALALPRFNDYHLAKYKAEGKSTSLVDVVNICHPKYTPSLTKLMKGELKNTETWEAKLSESQGDSEKKATAWNSLLEENKLGYLALLRNLRNIENQSPASLLKAQEYLLDEAKMRKALIMPFQILTAIQNVTDKKLIKTLNKALELSMINVPKFSGKTLVVLDVSCSMTDYKCKSEGFKNHYPMTLGAIFAGMLFKTNDADLMTFDGNARYIKLNPDDSIETMTNIITLHKGGSTNFHSVFQQADKAYDRIIILSDMQGWVGYTSPVETFKQYKKKHNADPFIYSFDLQGYGDSQFPENKIFLLTGFSGEIFKVMGRLEEDKDALIHTIDEIVLDALPEISEEKVDEVEVSELN